MAKSAWQVRDVDSTPAGRRYTVVLGQREWIVLHAGSGWQFWNGHTRCEADAGVRAAILDYERNHEVEWAPATRRWTTTVEDMADEALRTGFDGHWG
jgi:hypothetical protein